MKKLLTMFIFITISISVIAVANNYTRIIIGPNGNQIVYGTICIDGYKFAYAKSIGHNGISIVQMRQHRSKNSTEWLVTCGK